MDEPSNRPMDDRKPGSDPTARPATRSGSPVDTNMSRPTGDRVPDGQASAGFEFNNPTIISLLYLASYVTGITGIVGIVLAHVWQSDAAEWERSHHTYLIRTFWFGLLGFVAGFLLLAVAIGVLVIPAVGIWVAVRSVLSLVRAQKREPMPDPNTLLF